MRWRSVRTAGTRHRRARKCNAPGYCEGVAGRTDRLVSFLRVLDLAGVLAWRRVNVFVAVELARLVACGFNGRLRQRGRIGTHIGDVAVFRRQSRCVTLIVRSALNRSLRPASLLKRRCHERWVRATGVGFSSTEDTARLAPRKPLASPPTAASSSTTTSSGLRTAQGVEIASGRHSLAVDGNQPSGELWRRGVWGPTRWHRVRR